jgi:uncharacterized membrane protein YtjA (UPF0391 family)
MAGRHAPAATLTTDPGQRHRPTASSRPGAQGGTVFDDSSNLEWQGRLQMLNYALLFFVVAIVAAILGFGGIAAGAAGIAKILFFVFLAIAVVTFVMCLMRKGV